MNTLHLTEGTLTPSCSKSHISYVFNIDDNVSKLNIDFSYNPKFLDDIEMSQQIINTCLSEYCKDNEAEYKESWEEYLPIKNLLTLSIDDPHGFRGAAHRHPNNQKITISKEDATSGFIQGDIIPGSWTVTISVHVVVTETCNYKLHIWEGGR